MRPLESTDLAAALDWFKNSYTALDVFADDLGLSERTPSGWTQTAPNRFEFRVNTKDYIAEHQPERGVVRVKKTDGSSTLLGALSGAALGSLISKKPEAVLAGAVVGLLIGRTLREPAVRDVFTLRFDPIERQWRPYSGALVPFIKDSLGHQ